MGKSVLSVADLEKAVDDSCQAVSSLLQSSAQIIAASDLLIETLQAGGKILTAGNGGSGAEAMHMAEEFIGRFRTNRKSLPCLSLVADPTALTCIGNDFGFDHIFSRQIEGLGQPDDVLVLFTTSGKSRNLEAALEAARTREMKIVCILGRDGGALAGKGDLEIIVPGNATEHIQEAHQVLLHIFLDAVERAFPACS